MALVGRSWETAQLSRLLLSAAAGHGSSLALHGGIGTGKTALLAHAAGLATDAMVLRIQPTAAERLKPFASLLQIAGGWQDRPDTAELWARLHDLIAPDGGGPADPVEVGRMLLSALRALTLTSVVVLLVDDADLLEQHMMRCLRFVAGRVSALSAVVVLATTATVPELDGIDRLEVSALTAQDAAAMLQEERPGLTDLERSWLVAAAGGNPLALRTLPVPRAESDLGARELGEPLQTAVRRRLEPLTVDVRLGVLLVALAASLPVDQLDRVPAVCGVRPAPASMLRATGLVRLAEDEARITDPLVRAALVAELPPAERRAAAAAIADASPDDGSILRARMLAVAASSPDDAVADVVAAAADRALRQDAREDAIELWLAAARLSVTPRRAVDHLLAAGRTEWLRGGLAAAQELHRRARALGGDGSAPDRAWLAALVETAAGDCATAARLIERSTVGRPHDALHAEAAAWLTAAWRAGRIDPIRIHDEHDLPSGLPAPLGRAVLRVLDVWRIGGAPALGSEPALWAIPPAVLAVAWGVPHIAAGQYTALIAEARAADAVLLLAIALAERAFLDAMAGRVPEAAAAASESATLAAGCGARVTTAHALLAQTWISALRGDREQTELLAEQAVASARSTGNRAVLGLVRWHRGAAALFTGAPDAAVDLLAPLADPRSESHHPSAALFAAVDLGEAAARTGNRELARRQQQMLEDATAHTGAAWSRASAQLLSGMLTGDDDAERRLHAVRTALIGEPGPFLRARVELVLGEWLRRARRREDARAFLSNAADEFDALGAVSLADRARESLGLMLQPRISAGGAVLTGQENRIAALAAEGASNKAIAAQLFISPRTVGHHLSAIYRKLEVRSRSGLAEVLSEAAQA